MDHAKKMKIGGKTFLPSREVLESVTALRKWNELVIKFDGFEFISDIDNGILQRYCLLEAELVDILTVKRMIETAEDLTPEEKALRVDKLKLHSRYMKVLETMLKYEDRLFLNPAARIRSIPAKKEDKKESRLESLGFGNL